MKTREVVNQVSDDTALEIARYQDALDKQRRELTRLVARMKAAREILSDPTLKQYPVGTHVGKVLSNLRALLADDASEAVA